MRRQFMVAGNARRRGWLRSAIIAGGIFLLFGSAWRNVVVHTPIATIPFVAMPRPNAYETYVQAAQLVQGAELLNRMTLNGRRANKRPVRSLEEREGLLRRNAAALAVMSRGIKQEYHQPPLRSAEQPNPTHRFSHLARLIVLNRNVRADLKDWAGAFNALLDQIQFSESLMRGAGLESLTTAIAYRNMDFRGTTDPIDKLNAEQVQAGIRRLETILHDRVPFTKVLTEEKWYQLSIRDEMLAASDWRNNFSTFPNGGPNRFQQIRMQAGWLGMDKRQIMLAYNKYMDSCIDLASHAYGSIPTYPFPPGDPVNQQMASDPGTVHWQWMAVEAEDNKLLLRLALRAYLLDHGHYPSRLSMLMPTYLSYVPADPLASGSGFVYIASPGAYVLRSATAPPRQSMYGQIVQ